MSGKKCKRCGACQECGAPQVQPQIVPFPYPVYPPVPYQPYRTNWYQQPQTWGIGTTAASSGTWTQQPYNDTSAGIH